MKDSNEKSLDDLNSSLNSNLNKSISEREIRRSWWDRSFSPMQKGSLRGSIINILATAMGAGLLSLPYIMKVTGVIYGLILLTVGALSAYWSMSMLIEASEKLGSKRYLHVCQKAGGKKAGYLFQFAISFMQFGSTLGYQIVMGDLTTYILIGFGVPAESPILNSNLFVAIKMVIPAILILIPLSRMTEMDSLKYVSLIGVLAILYTMAVIVAQQLYLRESYIKGEEILWFNFDKRFYQACGVTFYTFSAQANFFQVYDELKDPTPQRMTTVLFRGVTMEYILCLLIAISGYLTYRSTTPNVITNCHPINEVFNLLLTIGKIGVYIKLISSIALKSNPLKRAAFDIIFGEKSELTEPENTIVTIGLFAATTSLAIICPSIISILSILGGFSAVVLAFILPTFVYAKSFPPQSSKWKLKASIFICILLSFFGAMSVVSTILSFIYPNLLTE